MCAAESLVELLEYVVRADSLRYSTGKPRQEVRGGLTEPALGHEPFVHAGRYMALLDWHAQIGGRPSVHDGRVPVIDQRPAWSRIIRWPGRIIPMVGVPDHGRARYAEPS